MREEYCGLVETEGPEDASRNKYQAKLDRLEQYEKMFGNIDDLQEISRYKGEVINVDLPDTPDGVRVEFQLSEGRKRIRVLPKKRLEAIGAAFPTAEVEYIIYENGATSASVLRYAGPTRKELLAQELDQLSEETLQELEKR